MPPSPTPVVKTKSILKKIGTIVASLIILIILILVFFFGAQKYNDWKFKKESAELLRQAEAPYYQDTYGGKTPKETLELFITAVEKEDFELASKYFVLSKQEEWRESLIQGGKSNKLGALKLVSKDAVVRLNKEESVWENGGSYVFLGKDSVSFQFVKYPSGIWKIQEI